jgi:hypothetical protein
MGNPLDMGILIQGICFTFSWFPQANPSFWVGNGWNISH